MTLKNTAYILLPHHEKVKIVKCKKRKWILKKVHKRMVKSGVTIFIPHDILKSKEMVSRSMRNISSATLSAVVHTVSTAKVKEE